MLCIVLIQNSSLFTIGAEPGGKWNLFITSSKKRLLCVSTALNCSSLKPTWLQAYRCKIDFFGNISIMIEHNRMNCSPPPPPPHRNEICMLTILLTIYLLYCIFEDMSQITIWCHYRRDTVSRLFCLIQTLLKQNIHQVSGILLL